MRGRNVEEGMGVAGRIRRAGPKASNPGGVEGKDALEEKPPVLVDEPDYRLARPELSAPVPYGEAARVQPRGPGRSSTSPSRSVRRTLAPLVA